MLTGFPSVFEITEKCVSLAILLLDSKLKTGFTSPIIQKNDTKRCFASQRDEVNGNVPIYEDSKAFWSYFVA